MQSRKWYQLEIAALLAEFGSDPHQGLTSAQVAANRLKFGQNQLVEPPGKTVLTMLLEQFKEFLVLLLFGAAVVSGFLGEWLDLIVILTIVVLNACLGVFQEYKAEQSLAALKKLAAPLAKVLRDGHLKQLPAAELVPGDIICD